MSTYTIDSLSLFITLDKINIIDKKLALKFSDRELTTVTTTYDEDYNELDNEEIENPRKGSNHKHVCANSNGDELYTTHYKYQNINTWLSNGTSESREGFAISIHSKHLHSSYLQGLTELNIDDVYDNIIAQKVLSFSREDFLCATVSDIDIKTDYHTDNFTSYTNLVLRNVILHWQGVARRMKSKNQTSGLQIFKREHKANPYFKLYNKQLELETKSKHFANEYLREQTIPNARVEITFCNSKTLQKYGLLPIGSNRTLGDMLRTVQIHGESAMCKVQREYINMVMFGTSESLNPEEIKGNEPAATVMKKIDTFLANHCLINKGIKLTQALGIATTFTRPNNHRYVKNYIITKYSHYHMDASLLQTRK